jgi:DNA repair exonuclease SbcCD ATPase subunit
VKLTSLTLCGVRGTDSTVDLGPLTMWVGPNGGGKTSAVGAIAYALTGRFPGFVENNAESLLALATKRADGFHVEVHGTGSKNQEVWIARGVDREGKNFLKVCDGDKKSRGNDTAKAMLAGITGEVQWFVDAFDQERSVWRLSAEKRKEWALTLCAGASGWSKERLIAEMGGAATTEFWDPNVSTDASAVLDVNLDRMKEHVNSCQRLVRDAGLIADGVSVETGVESRAETTEKAYEAARSASTMLERLIEDAKQRQAALERARRDRQSLTEQIERARAAVGKLTPPQEPQPPVLGNLADKEAELFDAERESEEIGVIDGDLADARRNVIRYKAELHEAERGTCPACDHDEPDVTLFAKRLEDEERLVDTMDGQLEHSHEKLAELGARMDTLRAEIQGLTVAKQVFDHDLSAYAAQQVQFEQTWQTALTSVSSLETQLAKVPADQPDVDTKGVEQSLQESRTRESKLKTELNALRAAVGVAKEREGQLKASKEAAERLVMLKALLARMRDVRDRMLDDAVDPLRAALSQLDALAHDGGHWHIRREGRDLDIGYTTGKQGSFLPANSLSAGEKYRATIALLVARSMVRREPSALLIADNFEQVYPHTERENVLRGLLAITNAGFLDNAFLAAACEPPDGLEGLLVYHVGFPDRKAS